ncbi:hypothetical protein [Glaesserella sp.]|uniref:hypothetical protein n=1 Tax=Glaesserella sp. TaxID=2094731 RepID=UPI00359FE385
MDYLIGKQVFFGCHLYKIVKGNIGNNTVSLQNVLTNSYARHCNGIIMNSEYSNEALFLYDSSFIAHKVENRVRLFCSNEGLTSFCITDIDGLFNIIEFERCEKEGLKSAFDLLTEADIPVKENVVSKYDGTIKVVALGSSSAEIFDYVFGDNQDYIPLWASGWSARGLRKVDKNISPYLKILNSLSKDSIILLHFGSVDIDFNLTFKMESIGFYKTTDFLHEMACGILTFRHYLMRELGFKHVYAVFTSPTVPLAHEYWINHFGIFTQLSCRMRAQMLWDFALSLSSAMPVINCLPDIAESIENPICARKYVRDYPDHHINFVAAQDIVYKKLKEHIPNILPARKKQHDYLYEHLFYDVHDAIRLNKPRPRTCR